MTACLKCKASLQAECREVCLWVCPVPPQRETLIVGVDLVGDKPINHIGQNTLYESAGMVIHPLAKCWEFGNPHGFLLKNL